MRESGSLAVFLEVRRFFMPPIRLQKLLRLLAALLPFLSLLGLVVTAVLSLDPGLAALYFFTPAAVRPPERDLWTPIFILGIFPLRSLMAFLAPL